MSDYTNNVVLIKVDSATFTILNSTLDKFPDCALNKVIKGFRYEFLFYNKNLIVADVNLDSFSIIINHLRGYPYYNLQEPLLSEVFYDATRFSLHSLVNEIKLQIRNENSYSSINNYFSENQRLLENSEAKPTSEPVGFTDLTNTIPQLTSEVNGLTDLDLDKTSTVTKLTSDATGLTGGYTDESNDIKQLEKQIKKRTIRSKKVSICS